MPSMTRWSKASDSGRTRRGTIWPSRTTGVGRARPTPEDRDLGIVDDRRGAGAAEGSGVGHGERPAPEVLQGRLPLARPRGELRELGRQISDPLAVDAPHHRHHEALVGVHRDADVVVALEDELARRLVQARVEARVRPERGRHRLDQEDRQGQVRASLAAALLVAAPHRLELGDVGLVVLGDVRDHRPGEREVLGAAPPDPAERLPLDRAPLLEPRQRGKGNGPGQGPGGLGRTGRRRAQGARGRRAPAPRRGRGRRLAARAGRGADVLVRDPAARAGPAHVGEVHTQLAREPAGRGGRGGREAGRGRRGRRRGARRGAGGARGRRRGRRSRRPGGAAGVAEAQQHRARPSPAGRPARARRPRGRRTARAARPGPSRSPPGGRPDPP